MDCIEKPLLVFFSRITRFSVVVYFTHAEIENGKARFKSV